ncbi:MAG: chemotaxis protein CheW [Planctomycetota bacterium]
MQLITFTIDGQSFAIESRYVIEVLPLVPHRQVPLLPDYVAGMFTYRGHLIPVVDLGVRLRGRPATRRLSTRIIVVHFTAIAGDHAPGRAVRVGLVAENVIATCHAEEADASYPALRLDNAPFLGGILRLGQATVHLLDVERLLPPEIVSGLFPDEPRRALP